MNNFKIGDIIKRDFWYYKFKGSVIGEIINIKKNKIKIKIIKRENEFGEIIKPYFLKRKYITLNISGIKKY